MSATEPEPDEIEAGVASVCEEGRSPRTPEQTALFETDGPFVWFASTDNLELSAGPVAALLRFRSGGPPMLGEIGQVDAVRLRDEFGWSASDVQELRAALRPFGIVLGQPVSAWDPEVGRAREGAFVR